ncbi:hypothetical protein CAPTEDRAFT_206625 [Capitella teleta]|uniref:Uncharacterized protein n=1 Tax=Capitella teleta TaxID=283909 RepID=R7TLX5_CAPTE|nr:hypothetical protein CAPTEDRAFT_206625 [Capitella teleta]|eukprot:ELT92110.1 hypothetical protein CAPTEDRAFT_206625 [Capitella teleta]
MAAAIKASSDDPEDGSKHDKIIEELKAIRAQQELMTSNTNAAMAIIIETSRHPSSMAQRTQSSPADCARRAGKTENIGTEILYDPKMRVVTRDGMNFDLMWISEVKTGIKVSVPGFITYNVDLLNSHRGGIILLVKHKHILLIKYVFTAPSQIWIGLSCCKDLVLGGCYIPPVDSDFSDPAIIGQIQAKLSSMWPERDGQYRDLQDETINT